MSELAIDAAGFAGTALAIFPAALLGLGTFAALELWCVHPSGRPTWTPLIGGLLVFYVVAFDTLTAGPSTEFFCAR